MLFTSITEDQILDGTATDAYFLRTENALDHAGVNPTVVADIAADQFGDGEYEVLAGVNDAANLLAEAADDIDVWSIPEGTLFDGGPVMRIKGPYRSFARFETSLLGFLSQASGIATNALKCKTAARFDENTSILSFGARHMHPYLSAVIERSALIGNVDGFSHVAAGQVLDKKPSGTMPHSLVLAMREQEKAWRSFNESVSESVPRIMLCDTHTDEADESIRAAELLGDDLEGIRLDTTGSRRGDFRHIIKEVRWKLETKGFNDIDIYVSGGLNPEDIEELRDIVDGFGIGGYISNADPVDFSLDIVERDGEPITKRGKLPGMKAVRRENGDHTIDSECNHIIEPTDTIDDGLFEKIVEDGKVIKEFNIDEAAKRAKKDSKTLNFYH